MTTASGGALLDRGAIGKRAWFWVRRMAPLAALVVVTVLLGRAGLGVARPVFVLGSVVVAWDLLGFGAGAHLSGSTVLFCLAPLLRRIVDVSVGYDPSGLMISGPLLGLVVVAPLVARRLAGGRRLDPALRRSSCPAPACFTLWS